MTKKTNKTKKKAVKAKKQDIVLTGQVGRIFEYLKCEKSATGLEPWRKCGVMSWAKKISQLNEILPSMGYIIVKERIKVYAKFARRTVSVMRYSLQKVK